MSDPIVDTDDDPRRIITQLSSESGVVKEPIPGVEEDIRSSKKIKSFEESFNEANGRCTYDEVWPSLVPETGMEEKSSVSFKEKLTGCLLKKQDGEMFMEDAEDESWWNRDLEDLQHPQEEVDENGEKICDFKVVMKDYRGIKIPSFSFSKRVKEKLQKPWRQSLIIKLLGRNIGFRALESRVCSMWGKNGTIELVDIDNGFYLAKFSNDEDYQFALTEGSWMIYDHYLTVRPWCPNFNPDKASIYGSCGRDI